MAAKKTYRVRFEPDSKSVFVQEGTTVYEASEKAGLIIKSECGGAGICGSCVVNVVQGKYEQSGSEKFLSDEEIRRGKVLACRTTVKGDLTVEVPGSSRLYEPRILTEGAKSELALSPNVRKYCLDLDEPSLEDQRSDLDRLLDALEEVAGRPEIGLDALRTLPGTIRAEKFTLTVVLSGNQIIGIEAGDTSDRSYGAAFDIGTTTVVGYLMDLNTGEQRAVAARSNPQGACGEDVVSRILYARSRQDGLDSLNDRIIGCINDIIAELERTGGIERTTIYEIAAAGNTTMNHLLLKLDPQYLAVHPYVGVVRSRTHCAASTLGIHVHPGGRLHTLPNIAAFVGGDTVGVILAAGLHKTKELRFAVDVGTNGELIMGNSERLLACSAAAGPAFEGARIVHGMRASDGAIEKVQISGPELLIGTIGNSAPAGICGTGLIDAVAELLKIGAVTESGLLLNRGDLPPEIPLEISNRFIDHERYGACVVLVRAEDSRTGEDILLTRKDVRELQLAKAAIRAGYEILKSELAVSDEDIREILLAGAFGNYIGRDQAKRIGLLPDVPKEKIRFIGNAAGEGAKMVLLARQLREEAGEISKTVEYLELSARRDFQDRFLDAQRFPGGAATRQGA